MPGRLAAMAIEAWGKVLISVIGGVSAYLAQTRRTWFGVFIPRKECRSFARATKNCHNGFAPQRFHSAEVDLVESDAQRLVRQEQFGRKVIPGHPHWVLPPFRTRRGDETD